MDRRLQCHQQGRHRRLLAERYRRLLPAHDGDAGLFQHARPLRRHFPQRPRRLGEEIPRAAGRLRRLSAGGADRPQARLLHRGDPAVRGRVLRLPELFSAGPRRPHDSRLRVVAGALVSARLLHGGHARHARLLVPGGVEHHLCLHARAVSALGTHVSDRHAGGHPDGDRRCVGRRRHPLAAV